ncbi:hypothetical protein BS47DRAFT_1368644 [Hydnum rufescens UP504]|uniref:Uncharacterized protein n=1 Tax=Hydnum rufescens UP504 TaxID=1448309 RepID=A0A9P6AEV2_9AGAM|nr:hypothetical protein BS47DRAFT_1368644 [Hydnum rufescens UP504]
MFVYLAAWCMIQGIVIEKAWFQDHSSNFVIKVAVEGLRAAEAALEFFHRGWPQWLTTATATAVRMEDARWNVLASNTTLGSAYDLFRPHPPLPLKLAHTPNIPVGWYLPLSSSSTPTASLADSPAVTDVATSSGAPSVGDKRKHVPDEDSGASMPPTKRFKGADVGPTDADPGPTEADPGPTEANPGLTEADPGIVGDEMEGVEHPLGDGDAMDIDAAVDGVERALNHDDAMDVDLDMDDLNEHIRHRMLRVPLLEFIAYYRCCIYQLLKWLRAGTSPSIAPIITKSRRLRSTPARPGVYKVSWWHRMTKYCIQLCLFSLPVNRLHLISLHQGIITSVLALQSSVLISGLPLEISQFLEPIDYLTGIVGINKPKPLRGIRDFDHFSDLVLLSVHPPKDVEVMV